MIHLKLPFTIDSKVEQVISTRLQEFQQIQQADTSRWFSELCFCLLTANAQAQKALLIQDAIGMSGFLHKSEKEIAAIIRSFGHRFHNTKARYIVQAREYKNIKDIISPMSSNQAREFLVAHVKGLGYKEASHFLRNVGYHDVAIIDRHIIRFLVQYKFISKIPKYITKLAYLELESLLKQFNIELDRLDLMIWFHMTGEVLK